ncbi:MAG TPA: hypothetical protein VFA11_15140 [Acidimicrobiales bacterium]|nr:hypothetical protein [Acidimicrobiales bacterium]
MSDQFAQIIEYKTAKFDEIQKLVQDFRTAGGAQTSSRAYVCRDRDSANTYVTIVVFPSYEEAMKNSESPQTQEMAKKMASLCDGPPSFRNST